MSSLVKSHDRAQPGPQTDFLRTPATSASTAVPQVREDRRIDLEPLRYVSRVPGFTAVFFRARHRRSPIPAGCGMRA